MLNTGVGRVVLKYFLAMKLDTFWAAGEAEREKVVRISLFCRKSNLYAYLKTRRDGIAQSSALLECLKKDLLSYLQGEKISFINYPLKMDNYSSFFIRICTLTQEIPYGELRSYKWLSERAGTKGYRAVGAALARNPFPILVPCHRVIKKNGNLGGYSAGLKIKKKLLQIEGTLEERESYLVSRISKRL
jgi:methylated-DNA-[protein]-cysteine S-methyltransferase